MPPKSAAVLESCGVETNEARDASVRESNNGAGSTGPLLLPGSARLAGPLSDYEMEEPARATELFAMTETIMMAE